MTADISNPAAPTIKGIYYIDAYPRAVAVAGNYAYVAAMENGLVIFDISNSASPPPPVPELSTMSLMSIGFIGLLGLARWNRRKL